MTITPEATPFILRVRSSARPANQADLRLVDPGTLIIDTKEHLLPPWYREPESKPVPERYQEAYQAKVPLSGIKFHVTGRQADYYQPINVANIVYCFDVGKKPVVILMDSNGHTVEIPLGDQNKSFIQNLADLQLQIQQAMSGEKPEMDTANKALRDQQKAIAENILITRILDGLGSGSTINDIAIRVAGGALK